MLRSFLLLFVASGLAAPCAAQRVSQKDSPCAGSVITVEVANCFYTAWQKQDAALNKLYGEILPVLVEDESDALKSSERAWIVYRDATCAAEKSLYGKGAGGGPARQACMFHMTRARVAELHAVYDWVLLKRRDQVRGK